MHEEYKNHALKIQHDLTYKSLLMLRHLWFIWRFTLFLLSAVTAALRFVARSVADALFDTPDSHLGCPVEVPRYVLSS